MPWLVWLPFNALLDTLMDFSDSTFLICKFSDPWRPSVNGFLYSPMKIIPLVLLQEQWRLIWLGQQFNVQRYVYIADMHSVSCYTQHPHIQNKLYLRFLSSTYCISTCFPTGCTRSWPIYWATSKPPWWGIQHVPFLCGRSPLLLFFSLSVNCWVDLISQDLIGLDGDEITEYLPSAGEKYCSWSINVTCFVCTRAQFS